MGGGVWGVLRTWVHDGVLKAWLSPCYKTAELDVYICSSKQQLLSSICKNDPSTCNVIDRCILRISDPELSFDADPAAPLMPDGRSMRHRVR